MDLIIFKGKLGRDPELKYLADGKAVVNFSVAVNGYRRDDGPKWYNVAAWGKTAENVNQYIRKGSEVVVEGRLDYDPDTGGPETFERRDGSVGSSFKVTARAVHFGSRASGSDEGGYEDSAPKAAPAAATAEPDKIVF